LALKLPGAGNMNRVNSSKHNIAAFPSQPPHTFSQLPNHCIKIGQSFSSSPPTHTHQKHRQHGMSTTETPPKLYPFDNKSSS
jgi:hypothetical protein